MSIPIGSNFSNPVFVVFTPPEMSGETSRSHMYMSNKTKDGKFDREYFAVRFARSCCNRSLELKKYDKVEVVSGFVSIAEYTSTEGIAQKRVYVVITDFIQREPTKNYSKKARQAAVSAGNNNPEANNAKPVAPADSPENIDIDDIYIEEVY